MSRLWRLPAALVVALVLGALVGIQARILSPAQGFFLFLMGVLLGALTGLGLAGAAAFASATGRPWRRQAVRAAVIPLVIGLGVIGYQAWFGSRVVMNDVSTDLEDPPAVAPPDVAAAPGAEAGAGLPEGFPEMQREGYPDVQPLQLPIAPEEALQRAEEAARAMPGWEVVDVDAEQGLIRATATTRIFRFVDDVAIRVRPDEQGARVDVRSRSRIGRGDMGANAARIRAYLDRLEG